MVEAYFRRLKYKVEQAEWQGDIKERDHFNEVYSSSETTLSKKLTGVEKQEVGGLSSQIHDPGTPVQLRGHLRCSPS